MHGGLSLEAPFGAQISLMGLVPNSGAGGRSFAIHGS